MTYREKYHQDHPEIAKSAIHVSNCVKAAFNSNVECQVYCRSCWDTEMPSDTPTAPTTPTETESTIKDSGDRTEFASGAVRDMREGKGRCDLLPLGVVSAFLSDPKALKTHEPLSCLVDFQKTGDACFLYGVLHAFQREAQLDRITMVLEVAKHFEQGAKKYGERNWEKGIPVRCYVDSAIRHYLKWCRGDKDEPHHRAFCWNILCAIWTCQNKPELNDYAPTPTVTPAPPQNCVVCGAIIPEGRDVCPVCEGKYEPTQEKDGATDEC